MRHILSFRNRAWSARIAAALLAAAALPLTSPAQDRDSTSTERRDSLEASVSTARRWGGTIARGKSLRTEVISQAGLQKMACCNVAESFENSAGTTVGYSDAVTGARQIRLLGLSGIYTQMLDESRPVMRGLSAPFGLTYMPGQWLESIQIAKGAGSAAAGAGSVTGQINLEHRKPTDEKPLFLSVTGMSDTRVSGDAVSCLQMGDHLSTALMAHVDKNFRPSDMNHDSFMDDPMTTQLNLSNRWLYYDPGFQVRLGLNAVWDHRKGGQEGYGHDVYKAGSPWGSDIRNRVFGTYLKVGVPLREDQSGSIALVSDYTYQDMDAYFGAASYRASQHSFTANLLWRDKVDDIHDFTLGAGGVFDKYREDLHRPVAQGLNAYSSTTHLPDIGAFGEYTLTLGEMLTAIAGVRAQWYGGGEGWRIVPRASVKFSPVEALVLRASGGRGLRTSMPLTDNFGVFSTGKLWTGSYRDHILEDGWTIGGSVTAYLPFGVDPENTYLSVEWFRTDFTRQLVVDYENGPGRIDFYSSDGRAAFTNTVQMDFAVQPVDGFTVNLTARYTDARTTLAGKGLAERPLTSRFKGVVNLQYKTRLSRWIFDATAALNGSCRVYDFMLERFPSGRTPVFPAFYAQVTRRFKGVDVFIGAENLSGFTQGQVLFGGTDSDGRIVPESSSFDASAVWGPLMGVRLDAGIRITVWKTY